MSSNKKQNALESALGRSDLSDSFAENPLVQWISQNGRTLLWLVLGIIALLLLGYRLVGGRPSGGSAKDYLDAEREIQLFLAAGVQEGKESLAKLTKILKSHPELQPKYDGQIAQALLIRGEGEAALPFAERTLARQQIPFYHDYSATALLIENQQYEAALQQAQALQAKMDEAEKGRNSGLYAMNLLRIATLYQQLGQKSEELQSYLALKQFLKENEQLLESLSEGELSLLDYIAFREKELSN